MATAQPNQSVIPQNETREVFGALRQTGTYNIYWESPFSQEAAGEIVPIVNRIHALLSGKEEFTSSENQNKCKVCRFGSQCDRALLPTNEVPD